MSYDVYLKRGDRIVSVPHHNEGGTRRVGGSDEAQLNVTYNYSPHYRVLGEGGLRHLDNRRASECYDDLLMAIKLLGVARDADYWLATPGNAGYALAVLLGWALLNPDAIFEVH